ncbi:hypothetical protein Pmar_PMAR015255 [Perkinsus marinus ATCC 50983]|uniref:Uncharacterized protein n=1 Tax=Perkinsus marinus (strain ATCC 50983 / TXsc) TaxID=423536 RepID=C5KL58_PERM5|nr:hypothetical protein Pmar_PMAR015255 [Perkinsus marinus ATCC 50983]EER14731.1 hypothetical protein Pmar_PMAR015255 [Perkinsus marinus ATCC 50983]|eukprot:XP_002782935.1 hypothetical protein Pmar_PMAR015255 [Perkinsus marinus ATCC 50983]
MLLCMLFAIGRLFFAFKPSRAAIIVKRALLLSSVSYLGRALCVPVTMLPNPDPMCMPRLVEGSPFWSVMLMPFGLSHTCADVFYSGASPELRLQTLYTGVVPLKFAEDPRLLWGTRVEGGDGSWSTTRGGIIGPMETTFRQHAYSNGMVNGSDMNTPESAQSSNGALQRSVRVH